MTFPGIKYYENLENIINISLRFLVNKEAKFQAEILIS